MWGPICGWVCLKSVWVEFLTAIDGPKLIILAEPNKNWGHFGSKSQSSYFRLTFVLIDNQYIYTTSFHLQELSKLIKVSVKKGHGINYIKNIKADILNVTCFWLKNTQNWGFAVPLSSYVNTFEIRTGYLMCVYMKIWF